MDIEKELKELRRLLSYEYTEQELNKKLGIDKKEVIL